MSTSTALEPTGLRSAVGGGHLPTLLMVLFQLTGDRRWLQDPFRPTPPRGLDDHPTGGFPPEIQDEIRDAAVSVIADWSAGTPPAVPAPTGDLLIEMASCCFGDEVPPEYAPMMAWQMGFTGPGNAEPGADAERAHRTDFTVAVLGAGISGMFAALRLREIGIPYVILERAADVGGVWRQNTYPGAGVDTPSHLYSFPFFHRDWSVNFARQPEVLQYLKDFAAHYDLYRDIRFRTEVTAAQWLEDEQCWELSVVGPDGPATVWASAIVSGVGLFKEGAVPDLPGRDEFPGPVFHSSQWPADLDLTGKRLAVVGTGASAMQVVAATSTAGVRIDVFQRTPQWIAPITNYFDEVTPERHWLETNVPYYRDWYRARLGWGFNDKVHPAMQIDPAWEPGDHSVNRINERHRRFYTAYIEQKLAGRPDLLAKAVPDYPPYGKRILMDNGWFDAIVRPNVDLITEAVAELTPTGVRTESGAEYPADVVAFCTGFQTNRYLHPIDVRGRNGIRLHEQWEDDNASAYLGVMTKNFPNLFFMYGPGTNAGGGSFVSLADSWLNTLVTLLPEVVEAGGGAVEPRADVHDDYNRRMDDANALMVWSHPGMGTYVRNSRGRVTVNMPWRIVDFWEMTRTIDLDDFVIDGPSPTRRRDLDRAWPTGD